MSLAAGLVALILVVFLASLAAGVPRCPTRVRRRGVPGDPDPGHRRGHAGRRIQDLAGRRSSRRRYDAAQTIGAFAARLRDQPDLDLLARDLLAVVDQTMEPTTAALWLAPPPK